MNNKNDHTGTPQNLKIIIWNMNGLGGKQRYLQTLINESYPDIVIITETKMKRHIVPYLDIGQDNYNIVQLRSTMYGRGGMEMLTKQELKLELVDVIRKEQGKNCLHAILMKNKQKEAVVGWYNSPGTKGQIFHNELKTVLTKYNVSCLDGDLNSQHPRWCMAHDEQRPGQQILKVSNELKRIKVHAPVRPTFGKIKKKEAGELRSSTVDLELGRDRVENIRRLDTYAATYCDHYPVEFTLHMKVEKASRPRRITKTLLESYKLAETASMYYEAA